MASMRRGTLARETGCNAETIRFYERAGLLHPPARSAGGHRRYTSRDAARLALILSARNLGLSLDEIRDLLDLLDGSGGSRATAGRARAAAVRILEITGARLDDIDRLAAAVERLVDPSPAAEPEAENAPER